MSMNDNAALVKELANLFNARDFEGSSKLVSNDIIVENVPFGTTYRGPEGYKEYNDVWIKGFSDGRIEITNAFSAGDYVALEFIGRGTHDGTLATPTGDLRATKRRVELHFCEICRVKDGKVSGVRLHYDSASMLRQLGITPSVTAPAGRRQPEPPPPTRAK